MQHLLVKKIVKVFITKQFTSVLCQKYQDGTGTSYQYILLAGVYISHFTPSPPPPPPQGGNMAERAEGKENENLLTQFVLKKTRT